MSNQDTNYVSMRQLLKNFKKKGKRNIIVYHRFLFLTDIRFNRGVCSTVYWCNLRNYYNRNLWYEYKTRYGRNIVRGKIL